MIKIRVVERKNPQNRLVSKYYGSPINEGIVSLDEIAEQISGRSTVTYGDILGVLQNFVEFVPFLLALGKSVNLGRLGSMRISFSSQGADKPEDYTADSITVKRIIFRPSVQLKEKIQKLKFTTVKP